MENLINKIALHREKLTTLGGSVRFDLPEGSIHICPKGHVKDDYQTADCSFRTTSTVLQCLIDGHIDPMSAVITGKLKFAGNVMVALKLKELFS
ncbi:SCP2 sterol-binding domain-containing protein [Flectobacillus major]|jgi:putative sterol carrier protein|uniref:SCP2 sterol-binding domain-containing protein n=1 Tax=Flectobacillus major TaxID=103 RepID=UPI000428D04E|nr:SCP2 sterol-binding domain-containing protein [Flectobacillus major]